MTSDKHSKIFYFSGIVFCIATAIAYVTFCIYYVSHSRIVLLQDYLAGGACFYGQDKFVAEMFSEAVKRSGDMFCIISIPFSILFAYHLFKLRFRSLLSLGFRYVSQAKDAIKWVLLLCFFCVVSWLTGHHYNAMCTDEAFSALNFAGEPVKRLLSYYPIANNHVFFNFVNHFAGKITGDAYLSGRIISGVFYALLIIGNFYLFRHFTGNNPVSFFCCCLLGLQFFVWGFGHQGRGYALCYLLEWGCILAFYYYFFSNGKWKEQSLILLLLCNIFGMWTIPVYLYFLLTQVFVALLMMVKNKKVFFPFWRTFVFSLIGIVLAYLPLFCYSGISAVIAGHNPDVRVYEIWVIFTDKFYELIGMHTFGFLDLLYPAALFCFFLPLVFTLVFQRYVKQLNGFIILYYTLWFSVFVFTMYTREIPIMRGLSGVMHISLLMLLLPTSMLVLQLFKTKKPVILLYSCLLVLLSVRMYNYNKENMDENLYGQNTQTLMTAINNIPLDFGKEKSIWLSDESFMWPFVLKDFKNVAIHNCNFNNQDILFVSKDDKKLPDSIMNNYTQRSHLSWFTVYERKF